MKRPTTDVYVLSVDPGLATGVAFFFWPHNGEPVLLHSWETQMETFAPVVRWALSNHESVAVACERFIINAKTVQNSQAPFSLEHIGILKQCLYDVGRQPEEIEYDSPTNAKKMFPNPALKKLGYWHKGGEGHALDAIRHGLLCMTKAGWVPKKLLE